MNVVIVTRHPGAVEWLRERGITGAVIDHATPDDIRGKHVIGALPMHLAAMAASVTVIDMPGLQAEQRGKDLTPAEMTAAGAVLVSYVVSATDTTPEDRSHDWLCTDVADAATQF